MALTNLAGFSEAMRTQITRQKGFHAIETMMFDEHPRIQQAGTRVCL